MGLPAFLALFALAATASGRASAPLAPNSSHYEKPPCRSDETEASVQGAGGELCAPSCDSGSCPADVPEGTKAKPQCILQDASSGKKYCALACIMPGSCPSGAKCARVAGFMGVCVYPQSAASVKTTLKVLPAPVPPTPAAPNSSHYEKPPCRSDETEASVQGAGGELCAPSCDSGSCPADVPEGTKAKPQCILQDASSGKKYCALACIMPGSCPSGAKCARVAGFMGVCVYPQSAASAPKTLKVLPAPVPPAAANSSHYEKPPCRSDETEASVQGAGGELCAPSCDSGSCPADVPEGTKAKPQCILQDASSGKKYCALACIMPGSCPSGAKCARVAGFMGVCVYPQSAASVPKTLKVLPAPVPPSAPNSSHYEKPPCRSDETEASVQGAGGELCAPSCDSGSCPADVPEGTKAKPQCILQDASSGKKYCALACIMPGSCPSGAKCARVAGFMGVCVYPQGVANPQKTLKLLPAPVPPSLAKQAGSHYEKPPCRSDETEASVQGAGGELCAPSCDSGSCPADVPEGTTAKPQCILQDASSGKKYCALECMSTGSCPSGAKCAKIGPVGVCVFPSSNRTQLQSTLDVIPREAMITV